MEIAVSSRHGNPGNEIKEYLRQKIEAVLEGRPLKIIRVNAILDIQKTRNKAEVIVNLKNHSFEADAETYNMQEAIDTVVDKIATQISRHLDRVQDHHKRKSTAEVASILQPEEKPEED
jgi:putative sigma-54 modulation protein